MVRTLGLLEYSINMHYPKNGIIRDVGTDCMKQGHTNLSILRELE
jgi:hypothetical protein